MAKTGDIEDNFEEKEFEWKITQFLATVAKSNGCMESPFFSFSSTSFYLKLWPKSTHKPGFSCVRLVRIRSFEYPAEYDFGMKKLDGNFEQLANGVLQRGEVSSGLVSFKTPLLSEIQKNRSEEAPLDVLIITCKLKRGRNNSYKSSPLNGLKSVELIKMVTFCENIKSVFTKEEFCDITVHVKDKEFKAHKVVLAAWSPVFATMVKHEMSENKTGVITITDCDPGPFQMFLEYLYCGRLENLSFRNAFHLYKVADKYVVPELKMFCVDYMGEIMKVENVCDVVVLAKECDDKKLFSLGQTFFNRNLKEIFESNAWKDLLDKNFTLANKLLLEMATEVKIYR